MFKSMEWGRMFDFIANIYILLWFLDIPIKEWTQRIYKNNYK
jgi:hypothetical protein